MKKLRLSLWFGRGTVFISVLMASMPLVAQTYTASPISAGSYGSLPYYLTGFLTVPQKSNVFFQQFGSGAVVKNPRVVFSCAHVIFDTGLVAGAVDPWLNGVRWYRAWSSGSQPSSSGGQLLRSFYAYVGYAAAALSNRSSPQSFSLDFVVHYAYEDTANGGYGGYWDDGVSQLKSNNTKLITGYPDGNCIAPDSLDTRQG